MRLLRLFSPHPGTHVKPRLDSGASKAVPVPTYTLTPMPSAKELPVANYTMLDDVTLSLIEAHDGEAHAIAGYVNGHFENWPAVVAKYSKSGKYLLSIDTQANPSAGAQALDVERFDASITQAPGWFKVTQAAGKHYRDLRWFPKIYVSAGSASALIEAMTKAGIARDEYRLWSAHYGKGEHLCAPGTCGYPQADATQYTETDFGVSLDASLCTEAFFDGPPPVEAPKPAPAPVVVAKPVVVEAPKPEPVKPVVAEAPVVVKPVEAPKPAVVVEAPKPLPAAATTLVYVQVVLDKVTAAKIGYPEGTICYVPHQVKETA